MSATSIQTQAQTSTYLKQKDIEHLIGEGFSSDDITQLQKGGMRSLTQAEAETMGFGVTNPDGKWQSSSGLYLPFTETFGQLRADHPPINSKGKLCKYLTPARTKSQAWLLEGCKVITEGYKDAAAGTLHGKLPTGALAGVSHYRALKEGSGLTVLFDADGRQNPGVFTNLVHAANYLNGKIQLVPAIPDEPKAGLCEYFKAGHTADDYKALIDSAMTSTAFLLALPDHWSALSDEKKADCARKALTLAALYLKSFEQEQLIIKIRKVTGLPAQLLRSCVGTARIKDAARKARKAKLVEPETSQQQGLILVEYDKHGKPIQPASSTVANIFAESCRAKLAWSTEDQDWLRYGSETQGLWSKTPDEFMRGMIVAELNASGLADSYNNGYVTSICELLKAHLAAKAWDEQPGLLPLQNGVLDLATRKLLAHAPGYRFTWQLPYKHDQSATCQPVQKWMLETMGDDPKLVELLRAYLKAIITGRTDLQRFVECLGPGGTGKSTYLNLAIALVGLQNTFVTSLKQLEGNRFETAGIKGKRLIVITDSERYSGSISVLKAVTGQDPLRNEQKNKQPGQSFTSSAMVLIAANEAIQTTDYTSGLERRKLTIPFLNQVAPGQRRDLLTINHAGTSGEFVDYLPGLLNWVLELPDPQMKGLILDTAISVPSLTQWKAEGLLESNPIAEWLDSHIVICPGSRTYVGIADQQSHTSGEPGDTITRKFYRNHQTWLYASYRQNCAGLGNHPVTMKRFVTLLEDLLRSQLKLPIGRGRDVQGSYFKGLAIRSADDIRSPRPITGIDVSETDDEFVTDLMTDADGSLTAESTVDVGFDGYDEFLNQIAIENLIALLPPLKRVVMQWRIVTLKSFQKTRQTRQIRHYQ
jgi:P4 family phage/plasmid primase-like protien